MAVFYSRKSKLSPPVVRTFRVNAFGGYRSELGENVLNLNKSKYCLNYKTRDGELVQTFGARSPVLKFDTKHFYIPKFDWLVIGVYQYERSEGGVSDDRLIVYISDGRLYSLSVDKGITEPTLITQKLAKVYGAYSYRLDDSDVLIITTADGFYILDDTELTRVENAPDVVDMCIHAERAFALTRSQPYKVWFSSNLDPSDWTISQDGGGYIEFSKDNGELKKVVSFLGYVYIFREYGIERVTAYADQSQFETRTVYACSDRIFPNTIAVCGDKIIFMSDTGLHYFDGVNEGKIDDVISREDFLNRGDKAVATYYKGNYLLSVYVERFDRDEYKNSTPYVYQNNAIICLSLDNGGVSVMSEYDVSGFCVYKSKKGSNLIMTLYHEAQTEYLRMMILDEEKCGRIGSVTYYNWETTKSDIGYPDKRKILRDITLDVKGTTFVTVLLDDKELKLGRIKDTQKTFRIMRPFKRFGFRLNGYGEDYQRISPPVVRIDMR